MSDTFHAVIWLDHTEAKVFHFSPTDVERVLIRARDPDRHVVEPVERATRAHGAGEAEFYQRIAESVADAGAILITGPADAKLELMAFIASHDPPLVPRISDVLTVDESHDSQLLALARGHFRSDERTHPRR